MLLIVRYNHKDENSSVNIIVVNIGTTGEGEKGKEKETQEFSTLITTNTFARGLLITRIIDLFSRMRASQCYQFVPAILSVLTALALINVILGILL